MKKCYLYLMQNQRSGDVKIGISSNPKHRLSNLRTSSPDRIDMIRTVEFSNRDEAYEIEQFLHNSLSTYQTSSKNEWFKEKVLRFLNSYDDNDIRNIKKVGIKIPERQSIKKYKFPKFKNIKHKDLVNKVYNALAKDLTCDDIISLYIKNFQKILCGADKIYPFCNTGYSYERIEFNSYLYYLELYTTNDITKEELCKKLINFSIRAFYALIIRFGKDVDELPLNFDIEDYLYQYYFLNHSLYRFIMELMKESGGNFFDGRVKHVSDFEDVLDKCSLLSIPNTECFVSFITDLIKKNTTQRLYIY